VCIEESDKLPCGSRIRTGRVESGTEKCSGLLRISAPGLKLLRKTISMYFRAISARLALPIKSQ
jgi:hypothetical protein